MRSKARSRSKLLRFFTVPIRALSKARDLYVRSVTSCASRMSYSNSVSLPTQYYSAGLPRSFSVVSSSRSNDHDDYRELIRAASVRNLGHSNETEMYLHQQQQITLGSNGLRKSCSVAMGRIDEDTACEFGSDDPHCVARVRADFLYPRCRSFAAVPKRGVVF